MESGVRELFVMRHYNIFLRSSQGIDGQTLFNFHSPLGT